MNFINSYIFKTSQIFLTINRTIANFVKRGLYAFFKSYIDFDVNSNRFYFNKSFFESVSTLQRFLQQNTIIMKLERKDFEYFYLYYKNPNNDNIIYKEKDIVYTNVFNFKKAFLYLFYKRYNLYK